MKKILIILFLMIGVFSNYQIMAYPCDPCPAYNWSYSSTSENYNGCSITIYYKYKQCGNDCVFRITGISDPNSCLNWNDVIAILEWGTKKMIQHANICKPSLPNECIELIYTFNAACWKWVSAGPSGGYSLVPCQENSCCEAHWMWCRDANGNLMDPYQTYFSQSTVCENPGEECIIVCP
jgi:hypothetical protein